MTTLRAKNKNHIFTITAELDPPKSASSEITEKQVAEIADTWMLSISLTAPWQSFG